MKNNFFPFILALIIVPLVAMSFAGDRETNGKAPSMVGTYKLMLRDLPDGAKLTAPNIMGLLTFTEKYRNFNVVWQDENGKRFSYSLVSEYKLTATEYTETIIFNILNDEINGQQIAYDLVGKTKTVAVIMEGSKILIDMPFEPASIVFDENWITGKAMGQFTDYWERVP